MPVSPPCSQHTPRSLHKDPIHLRIRWLVASYTQIPCESHRMIRMMVVATLMLTQWPVLLKCRVRFCIYYNSNLRNGVVCVQSNWTASKRGWTRSTKTWEMQRKTWRVWKNAVDSVSCHGNGKCIENNMNRNCTASLKWRIYPAICLSASRKCIHMSFNN